MELLKLIGFRSTDIIEVHGVGGGDLLELNEQELRDELKLPHLQVLQSFLCRSTCLYLGQHTLKS